MLGFMARSNDPYGGHSFANFHLTSKVSVQDQPLCRRFFFYKRSAARARAEEEAALGRGETMTDAELVETTIGPLLVAAVEYPALVQNPDRAMETMFGPETLGAALRESKPVVVDFGAGLGINSHGVSSTCRDSAAVVLKIIRQRRTLPSGETVLTVTGAQCVGRVTSIHTFDQPADFQYLCPTTTVLSDERADLMDLNFFETETELRTVPASFAGNTCSLNYA